MMHFKQAGVALVQVLLMVAIMALIAIQFSRTATNQVNIAQDFKQRLEAELLLRTTRSRVLYQFFKLDSEQLSDKKVEGVDWNLRDDPIFFSDHAEVKIQAISGLLSLNTAPPEMLTRLFRANGASEAKAQEIVASIGDWVDTDDSTRNYGAESRYYRSVGMGAARNGPMQDISELQFVKGMDEALFEKTKTLVSIHSSGSFNPALAPVNTVKALFSEDVAQQIINAQKQQQFTESVWRNIIGSRDLDYIDVHPRALFSVQVTVNKNDVRLRKSFELLVQTAQARDPMIILSSY